MESMKEKILQTALELFAARGYDAVSVRDISSELGVTQSALYKHYGSKRDIFDAIVSRMAQEDELRAREYEVPEQKYETQPDAYRATELRKLGEYTLAQFEYWTKDDFASKFRRMATLEQYSTAEGSALYTQSFSGGVIDYVADLFREMEGVTPEDAQLLALEFYGPVFMSMSLCDSAGDKQQLTDTVKKHIDRFIQRLSKKEI